jgi:hypothetical protein
LSQDRSQAEKALHEIQGIGDGQYDVDVCAIASPARRERRKQTHRRAHSRPLSIDNLERAIDIKLIKYEWKT